MKPGNMMAYKVRLAQIEDAAALARVHVDVWRTTYAGIMPDELLRSLKYEDREIRWRENLAKATNAYFVAEVNNLTVGFVAGGPIRNPVPGFDSELFAVYVLKDHQGCGIGRALSVELIRWLVEKQYKAMMLWVLDENPSRRFYESLGGKLLHDTKTDTFGGKALTEVGYGWSDLRISLSLLEKSE